jgi:RNA-directed DNA polymerase
VRLPPATHLVVLVKGTRSDAEALRTEIGGVLADQLKMTLSEDKTLVTHIDSGFDFLGFHIRRKTRGADVESCSPGRPRPTWRP